MTRPRAAGRACAAGLLALAAGAAVAAPAAAQRGPAQDYLVFVASEARDQVALVRYGPGGATVERTTTVGRNPVEPDGPHGLGVAPGGAHYFVSMGHGLPYGTLFKYATANDRVLGWTTLGDFPASLQVSPDGAWVYVVNFNLHGEMVPSSVSVVSAEEMVEVARIPTCTMPHGSRFNPQGTRHYSVCMMDDLLVEIDASAMAVARHFRLTPGAEMGMQGSPAAHHAPPGGTGHGHGHGHGHAAHAAAEEGAECSPTWVHPSSDGGRVWVACNASNEVVEVNVAEWRVLRRLPAGDGVYNLAATHDDRLLVATNKRGGSVSVIDLRTGRERARIETQRPVVHGVVVSPDDRYAFVSVEGIGSEPGTVEVIDLRTLRRVASVDVGQMAGGIDFWRTEPAR